MKPALPTNPLLLGAGVLLILVFLAAILVVPGWLSSRNQILVTAVGDSSSANWTETVYPINGGNLQEVQHQGLHGLIDADDFRIAGIQYVADIKPDFLVPGVLDQFNVVILYDAPVCDRTARQVLADFVEKGGQLAVIGDACTRVVDSPQTGWSIGNNRFGEMMPAVFQGVRAEDVELKIYAASHPIFNGIKNTRINGSVFLVYPSANASVLAFMNSTDVESGNALYGVLEKTYGKGRVVYFAYDPFPGIATGGSRNMILNLLLYLGRR